MERSTRHYVDYLKWPRMLWNCEPTLYTLHSSQPCTFYFVYYLCRLSGIGSLRRHSVYHQIFYNLHINIHFRTPSFFHGAIGNTFSDVLQHSFQLRFIDYWCDSRPHSHLGSTRIYDILLH